MAPPEAFAGSARLGSKVAIAGIRVNCAKKERRPCVVDGTLLSLTDDESALDTANRRESEVLWIENALAEAVTKQSQQTKKAVRVISNVVNLRIELGQMCVDSVLDMRYGRISDDVVCLDAERRRSDRLVDDRSLRRIFACVHKYVRYLSVVTPRGSDAILRV